MAEENIKSVVPEPSAGEDDCSALSAPQVCPMVCNNGGGRAGVGPFNQKRNRTTSMHLLGILSLYISRSCSFICNDYTEFKNK